MKVSYMDETNFDFLGTSFLFKTCCQGFKRKKKKKNSRGSLCMILAF